MNLSCFYSIRGTHPSKVQFTY